MYGSHDFGLQHSCHTTPHNSGVKESMTAQVARAGAAGEGADAAHCSGPSQGGEQHPQGPHRCGEQQGQGPLLAHLLWHAQGLPLTPILPPGRKCCPSETGLLLACL